jgi:outer membrane protein assembly factor BamB
MRKLLLVGLLLAWPPCAHVAADDNWPQFRGKQAGVVEGKGFPETWSTSKNVVWKIEIPGSGWSSPIVWGNRIVLTSVIREGKPETPTKGLYFGGNRLAPPSDVHRWMVYCIDWSTGKILWERQAHQGVPESSHHIKNTYASETPVTDGERVYAYFGNVGLFCYDLDGKELWSRKFGAFPTLFAWGTAASPVLHKDRIYVLNDNEKESFLVALDKVTGKEVWRIDRDEKSNWATPFIWENEQRTEIITCGKKKVRSYDLDGKLLWELAGMSSIVIPTPFAKSGLLYVSSGYVLDPTRPIFAIRPGAAGDITLKDGETSNAFVAWYRKQAGPYNPSPLIYGDYLYVLYDRGLLSCYDARTGNEIYTKERIDPKASAFTSSPWAYDGKIFCLSEDGDTFVIQAGPKYALLGKNSLEEMCMATPAIARRSLLIRTLSKLYRIQEGAAASEP